MAKGKILIDKYASKINLSNRNLKEFPIELFECKNLRKLNISNNQIKSIPKEISKLTRLESFDLSNNKISILYSNLFELRKLKTLILNYNSLKLVPKQISKLKELKKFSVAGNQLSTLPPQISELENLEELNIANNHFLKFPAEVLEIRSLTTLWLNNNKFNSFPAKEIFLNLKRLNKIYCYTVATNRIGNLNFDYLWLTRKRGNSLKFLKSLVDKKSTTKTTEAITNKVSTEAVEKISNIVQQMGDHTSPNAMIKQRNKVFISYSHNDKKWLDKMTPYLKGMQLEGLEFDYWVDTRIELGQKWKAEITKALDEAHTAILLISQDFLASEFIQNDELPKILENAEQKGVNVFPVILTHCRFTKIKILKDFQALNDPKTPLNTLHEHQVQEAFLNLTYRIEDSMNFKQKSQS